MLRRFFALVCLIAITAPSVSWAAESFNPNFLISDQELVDVESMTLGDIQALLQRGSLAVYRAEDVDGNVRTAAEIIWLASLRNGVSSRVILVTLQKEQSLITDPSPSKDQLDWAMGYGVCDDCSHDDPDIQRFRGFAKQINSATLQLTDGYLSDLETIGVTVMGFAPGEVSYIDGTRVIPANNATAALYTYTPHLHGNQNFVTLWHRWFSLDYPTGSLLQNNQDGGVWLIQYGKRRPITSRTALLSRYNESAIVPVDPTELEAYPVGRPISLPNYSLLQSDDGDIYLLVDDTLRHIVSMEAFRAIGFNPDDILLVSNEELSLYDTGEPITTDTMYPQGALLQNTTTGGVYYVEDGIKHPIMSRELLDARFASRTILPSSEEELDALETGDPVTFLDGALIGVLGEAAVHVVSEGKRRPIASEDVFEAYGWKWENVVWTSERAVSVHPLGELLDRTTFDTDGGEVTIAGN